MTNYEKNKEIIDLMLQRGEHIALNKNTKEIASCQKLECEDCLFSRRYNWPYDCTLNRMKWLVSEYVEPEIDWSKVPIDTPVLISGDGKEWYRRYFSGVDENGSPTVFCCGATRWSSKNYDENENTWNVNHIKLAEVEE